jgi:hypothetical protein
MGAANGSSAGVTQGRRAVGGGSRWRRRLRGPRLQGEGEAKEHPLGDEAPLDPFLLSPFRTSVFSRVKEERARANLEENFIFLVFLSSKLME